MWQSRNSYDKFGFHKGDFMFEFLLIISTFFTFLINDIGLDLDKQYIDKQKQVEIERIRIHQREEIEISMEKAEAMVSKEMDCIWKEENDIRKDFNITLENFLTNCFNNTTDSLFISSFMEKINQEQSGEFLSNEQWEKIIAMMDELAHEYVTTLDDDTPWEEFG